MMDSPSILSKPFIDSLLKDAKANLKKDGYLVPTLFVEFADHQRAIIGLMGPMMDPQQKQLTMSMVGRQLRDKGGEITVAVMMVEGWYVKAKKSGALRTAPSQHPDRQEAICVIGRDASNSRTTSVVQPFTRGKNNQPVWRKTPLAVYNQPAATSGAPMGLLDYLFTDKGTH